MSCIKTLIIIFCVFVVNNLYAQNNKERLAHSTVIDTSLRIKKDTAVVPKKDTTVKKDTLLKSKHSPQKATRRSAIIPGWGQAYNHQYWKMPIVWGALAVPASLFVYNNHWYQETKYAYELVIAGDTANYHTIDPKLQGLISSPESLQFYRNEFRRDRDYSVLFFMIAWGLNVVDATVSGHLRDFDVSQDLSMRIKPDYNPFTKKVNLGLAFNFKTPQRKQLPTF
jgi:Family of unknown function (DUF5683)